jgi:eukaryotic-like serine/threonine-protein kinase
VSSNEAFSAQALHESPVGDRAVNVPVEVGQVLADKYRVERVLGAGGMGVVVAATHLELGQLVAMKFLLAEGMGSPEVAARFIREARAAAQIRGEHVARVIDVGRLESGSPYIVMEYLEGVDLEELVRRQVVSIEEAVDYLIQACDAMAEAHRLGIIHRDLKPANLFLAQGVDGQGVVKVLDFGISKNSLDTTAGSLTATSALVGSPLYMSPEQMRSSRNVDHRTDIWSLGAVLFELLARRPPYEGETVGELMAKVLMDPLPSLRSFRSDVPVELEAVVARCLSKDPGGRFGNVAELSQALAPFAPNHSAVVVARMHRILGSVRPPATSSAPPAPSQAPVAARTPDPARITPDPRLTPDVGRSVAASGAHSSLAVSGTAHTEPVGKGTTHSWGSERRAASGSRLLLVSGGVIAVLAIGGFWLLRSQPSPPALGETTAGSHAVAGSPPAAIPAPVVTPGPVVPQNPEPIVSVAAPPLVSASARPAPPSNAASAAPKAPRAPRARTEATVAPSAAVAPKSKDSRLHMELKK